MGLLWKWSDRLSIQKTSVAEYPDIQTLIYYNTPNIAVLHYLNVRAKSLVDHWYAISFTMNHYIYPIS
jgi:hypothetical protein